MSIEKNIQPQGVEIEKWEVFRREIETRESKLSEMINAKEAVFEYTEDKKGNLTSVRIFSSKDGTLLYFKDIEGINRYQSKLIREN